MFQVIILACSQDINISKVRKLGGVVQQKELNLPGTCALGGKLTTRKNLLLNKLHLCICTYVNLLSLTSNWGVTREDRKRNGHMGSVKVCPISHVFSLGLCLTTEAPCQSLSLPLPSSVPTQLADLNETLLTKHIRSTGYWEEVLVEHCTGAGDVPLDRTPS